MEQSSRFVVDMQVTGKCNLSCDFCDGAPKKYSGASLPEIKKGIDKLVKAGLTTLNISGGEPLVRKDISEILEYAHSHNLEVYLSTNGLLLHRYPEKIFPYIKTLGLPLDGSTSEMNQKMTRGAKQKDVTVGWLRYFKDNLPSFSIKVGTVVSAINIDDLPSIGNVIYDTNVYPPDVWRLYEFTPLGDGLYSKKRHEISTQQFSEIVMQIKKSFPTKNIIPLSNADSNDSYIFVDPRMIIQIYTNNNYKTVGNLLDISDDDLIRLIQQFSTVITKSSANREWLSLKGKTYERR